MSTVREMSVPTLFFFQIFLHFVESYYKIITAKTPRFLKGINIFLFCQIWKYSLAMASRYRKFSSGGDEQKGPDWLY